MYGLSEGDGGGRGRTGYREGGDREAREWSYLGTRLAGSHMEARGRKETGA